MNYISVQHKKEIALSSVISDCFDGMVHINDNKNLEAILMLAKATFDPDEFMNWFEFENMNYEIFEGADKIILDTPEKLYDYLVGEYPYEPKKISRELFFEIIRLNEEQSIINQKLAKAFEDYAESNYIVIEDKYHSALMLMIKNTFDFYETFEYWLYEDCKKFTINGKVFDITTKDALYDYIYAEFVECSGKPPKRIKNKNAKIITQEELFALMKKQLLKGR
ncbi:MAG: hypothetical protein FWH03_00590 [Firmicutes bacterium]|nr:hypothetical protein [Bacillota bacterium]